MGSWRAEGNVIRLYSAASRYHFNQEQRQSQRWECNFTVGIEENDCRSAVVRNISVSGIQIRVSKRFNHQSIVKLNFHSNEWEQIPALQSNVQWMKDDGKNFIIVGLRFVELTELGFLFLKYILVAFEGRQSTFLPSLKPLALLSDPMVSKSIVNRIQSLQLSPFLKEVTVLVKEVLERPGYLWQWCYEEIKNTTLDAVSQDCKYFLYNTKLLSVIFLTLLDDLADKYKNEPLLLLAMQIPYGTSLSVEGLSEKEKTYLDVCSRVWKIIISNLTQFPRYKEFENILLFDYQQLFTTMRHAILNNMHPCMLNLSESVLYQGYNMHIVINLMMDVMCCSNIDRDELGVLRSIALKAQSMCRIANWLATWERELQDLDYTSGVIACAVERKYITLNGLQCLSADDLHELIDKIRESDIEASLMYQWEAFRQSAIKEMKRVSSVDLTSYCQGMEHFFQSQLASKGLQ